MIGTSLRGDVETLARRFEALLDQVRDAAEPRLDDEADWIPPLDLYEAEGAVVVARILLPGIARDEIQVHLDHDVLVISGECRRHDRFDERLLHGESPQGRFCRRLPLGRLAFDLAGVTARFQNGVLEIRLPPAPAPTLR